MKKSILILFAAAGMIFAAAKSYTVTFFQPSIVAGTELKPGSYKVEVQDQNVVIKKGKETVTAPVKVENEPNKFASTTVRYNNGDGKYKVTEIRLGGTNMKLVLND